MEKLSEVKEILDSGRKPVTVPAGESPKELTSGEFPRSASMEETTQVVAEVKDSLSVVKDILESEDELENEGTQKLSETKTVTQTRNYHIAAKVQDSLPLNVSRINKKAASDKTVMDIAEELSDLSEQITYEIKKPHYVPLKDDDNKVKKQIHKYEALDQLSDALSKDINDAYQPLKSHDDKTRKICSEHVKSPEIESEQLHIKTANHINALAEFLYGDIASEKKKEDSTYTQVSNRPFTIRSSRSASIEGKTVRFDDKITVLPRSASKSPEEGKSENSPCSSNQEDSGRPSVLQRIKAYEAAREKLDMEVEKFRQITSLESEILHQKARLQALSEQEKDAGCILEAGEEKEDEDSDKEEDTSPVVVEETHTMRELFSAWESSPEKLSKFGKSASPKKLSGTSIDKAAETHSTTFKVTPLMKNIARFENRTQSDSHTTSRHSEDSTAKKKMDKGFNDAFQADLKAEEEVRSSDESLLSSEETRSESSVEERMLHPEREIELQVAEGAPVPEVNPKQTSTDFWERDFHTVQESYTELEDTVSKHQEKHEKHHDKDAELLSSESFHPSPVASKPESTQQQIKMRETSEITKVQENKLFYPSHVDISGDLKQTVSRESGVNEQTVTVVHNVEQNRVSSVSLDNESEDKEEKLEEFSQDTASGKQYMDDKYYLEESPKQPLSHADSLDDISVKHSAAPESEAMVSGNENFTDQKTDGKEEYLQENAKSPETNLDSDIVTEVEVKEEPNEKPSKRPVKVPLLKFSSSEEFYHDPNSREIGLTFEDVEEERNDFKTSGDQSAQRDEGLVLHTSESPSTEYVTEEKEHYDLQMTYNEDHLEKKDQQYESMQKRDYGYVKDSDTAESSDEEADEIVTDVDRTMDVGKELDDSNRSLDGSYEEELAIKHPEFEPDDVTFADDKHDCFPNLEEKYDKTETQAGCTEDNVNVVLLAPEHVSPLGFSDNVLETKDFSEENEETKHQADAYKKFEMHEKEKSSFTEEETVTSHAEKDAEAVDDIPTSTLWFKNTHSDESIKDLAKDSHSADEDFYHQYSQQDEEHEIEQEFLKYMAENAVLQSENITEDTADLSHQGTTTSLYDVQQSRENAEIAAESSSSIRKEIEFEQDDLYEFRLKDDFEDESSKYEVRELGPGQIKKDDEDDQYNLYDFRLTKDEEKLRELDADLKDSIKTQQSVTHTVASIMEQDIAACPTDNDDEKMYLVEAQEVQKSVTSQSQSSVNAGVLPVEKEEHSIHETGMKEQKEFTSMDQEKDALYLHSSVTTLKQRTGDEDSIFQADKKEEVHLKSSSDSAKQEQVDDKHSSKHEHQIIETSTTESFVLDRAQETYHLHAVEKCDDQGKKTQETLHYKRQEMFSEKESDHQSLDDKHHIQGDEKSNIYENRNISPLHADNEFAEEVSQVKHVEHSIQDVSHYQTEERIHEHMQKAEDMLFESCPTDVATEHEVDRQDLGPVKTDTDTLLTAHVSLSRDVDIRSPLAKVSSPEKKFESDDESSYTEVTEEVESQDEDDLSLENQDSPQDTIQKDEREMELNVQEDCDERMTGYQETFAFEEKREVHITNITHYINPTYQMYEECKANEDQHHDQHGEKTGHHESYSLLESTESQEVECDQGVEDYETVHNHSLKVAGVLDDSNMIPRTVTETYHFLHSDADVIYSGESIERQDISKLHSDSYDTETESVTLKEKNEIKCYLASSVDDVDDVMSDSTLVPDSKDEWDSNTLKSASSPRDSRLLFSEKHEESTSFSTTETEESEGQLTNLETNVWKSGENDKYDADHESVVTYETKQVDIIDSKFFHPAKESPKEEFQIEEMEDVSNTNSQKIVEEQERVGEILANDAISYAEMEIQMEIEQEEHVENLAENLTSGALAAALSMNDYEESSDDGGDDSTDSSDETQESSEESYEIEPDKRQKDMQEKGDPTYQEEETFAPQSSFDTSYDSLWQRAEESQTKKNGGKLILSMEEELNKIFGKKADDEVIETMHASVEQSFQASSPDSQSFKKSMEEMFDSKSSSSSSMSPDSLHESPQITNSNLSIPNTNVLLQDTLIQKSQNSLYQIGDVSVSETTIVTTQLHSDTTFIDSNYANEPFSYFEGNAKNSEYEHDEEIKEENNEPSTQQEYAMINDPSPLIPTAPQMNVVLQDEQKLSENVNTVSDINNGNSTSYGTVFDSSSGLGEVYTNYYSEQYVETGVDNQQKNMEKETVASPGISFENQGAQEFGNEASVLRQQNERNMDKVQMETTSGPGTAFQVFTTSVTTSSSTDNPPPIVLNDVQKELGELKSLQEGIHSTNPFKDYVASEDEDNEEEWEENLFQHPGELEKNEERDSEFQGIGGNSSQLTDFAESNAIKLDKALTIEEEDSESETTSTTYSESEDVDEVALLMKEAEMEAEAIELSHADIHHAHSDYPCSKKEHDTEFLTLANKIPVFQANEQVVSDVTIMNVHAESSAASRGWENIHNEQMRDKGFHQTTEMITVINDQDERTFTTNSNVQTFEVTSPCHTQATLTSVTEPECFQTEYWNNGEPRSSLYFENSAHHYDEQSLDDQQSHTTEEDTESVCTVASQKFDHVTQTYSSYMSEYDQYFTTSSEAPTTVTQVSVSPIPHEQIIEPALRQSLERNPTPEEQKYQGFRGGEEESDDDSSSSSSSLSHSSSSTTEDEFDNFAERRASTVEEDGTNAKFTLETCFQTEFDTQDSEGITTTTHTRDYSFLLTKVNDSQEPRPLSPVPPKNGSSTERNMEMSDEPQAMNLEEPLIESSDTSKRAETVTKSHVTVEGESSVVSKSSIKTNEDFLDDNATVNVLQGPSFPLQEREAARDAFDWYSAQNDDIYDPNRAYSPDQKQFEATDTTFNTKYESEECRYTQQWSTHVELASFNETEKSTTRSGEWNMHSVGIEESKLKFTEDDSKLKFEESGVWSDTHDEQTEWKIKTPDSLKLHFAQCIELNTVIESVQRQYDHKEPEILIYEEVAETNQDETSSKQKPSSPSSKRASPTHKSRIPVARAQTLPRSHKSGGCKRPVPGRSPLNSPDIDLGDCKKSNVMKHSKIPVRRSLSQPIACKNKPKKKEISSSVGKKKDKSPSLSRSSSGESVNSKRSHTSSPSNNRLWFASTMDSSHSSGGEKYIELRNGVYTYKGSPEEEMRTKQQKYGRFSKENPGSPDSTNGSGYSSNRDSVASIVFSPDDFNDNGSNRTKMKTFQPSKAPYSLNLNLESSQNESSAKVVTKTHYLSTESRFHPLPVQDKPILVKSPIQNLNPAEVPVERRTEELQAVSMVSSAGVEEVLEFTSTIPLVRGNRNAAQSQKFVNTNHFLSEGLGLAPTDIGTDPGIDVVEHDTLFTTPSHLASSEYQMKESTTSYTEHYSSQTEKNSTAEEIHLSWTEEGKVDLNAES